MTLLTSGATLGFGCAVLLLDGLAGRDIRRRAVARWKRVRPAVLTAGLLGCLLTGLGGVALFVTLTQGAAALTGPRVAAYPAGYGLIGAAVAIWWWQPSRGLEAETPARTAIAGLIWPVTLALSLFIVAVDRPTPRRIG